MKRILFGVLTALMVLGGFQKADAAIYSWRQQLANPCTSLTTATSCGGVPCVKQDLCWDTGLKIMYTCDPNSGSTCGAAADWKAGGGGWVDTGTVLYPLNTSRPVVVGSSSAPAAGIQFQVVGNMHIGANLFRCDASNGCRIDSSNSGSTNVTISPTGVFTTAGGYVYTGANPFFNVSRSADQSSPATGSAWYNSTGGYWAYNTGALVKRGFGDKTYSQFFTPAASTNVLLWKAKFNSRINNINCMVDPTGSGQSVIINIQSCNANGSSCSNVDTTSITCANTNTSDDGSINSPAISAGGWYNLSMGVVTSAPTRLYLTIDYSETP